MRTAQNIFVAALLGFSIFSQWQVGQARDATKKARVRGDSIAAEAVVAAFAQDSTWEVRFAAQSDDLGRSFEESGDTARARLGRDLKAANVRIDLLAEVVASARGEVISVGNRAGTLSDSLSQTIETCEGAWEGKIDDGLLRALWGFTLPEVQHTLNYRVEIPGEIVVSTAGDGRTIVSAKSNHPQASFQLDSVLVDPPPPVIEVRLSKRDAVIALILGAFGWEIAR